MTDDINHPRHYTFGKIEVIAAIVDWKLDFVRGNVVKYLVRAGKKAGNSELTDLRKAKFYLDYLVEQLEGESEPQPDTKTNTPQSPLIRGEVRQEPEDEWNPPEPKCPYDEPSFVPVGKDRKINHCMAKITSLLKVRGEMHLGELAKNLDIAQTNFSPSSPTSWARGLKQAIEAGMVGCREEGGKKILFRQ